jgi:uncharacterized protein YjbI with pentapeptide repeats
MNKYVRKLFGVMFQSQQTQQIVHIQARHAPTSPEEWRQYWQAEGFPWRTEPEIDVNRQEELSKCRTIVPNIEQGIYPFKEVKLSRADVEWLLATHENGRGPVDWQDIRQRTREGLDLRGVDLRKMDLHHLPLARTRSGLKWLATASEWLSVTAGMLKMARIDLEGANLTEAHLEGAHLINAKLKDAYLAGAYLNEANLSGATLEDAYLIAAHLEDANLTGAYLVSTNLQMASLHRANLTRAIFDPITHLEKAILGEKELGFASLADISWGGADLTVIDWESVSMLGEECKARKSKRLEDYQTAVRANRQLAITLQTQGLNEGASRFAYRAQVLQRKVLWKQRSFWKWLGSAILALLTGYGYRMWRILVAYVFIVLLCAVAYFVLGMYYEPHLSFLDAVLTSITAFHGRVFSEPFLHTGASQLWVTAFEAVMGLVIEGVFIAMLTQKFFGK